MKNNCIFYDYGDTAPREYGSFCSKTKTSLEPGKCNGCLSYIPKIHRTAWALVRNDKSIKISIEKQELESIKIDGDILTPITIDNAISKKL